ncbi:MAG TPA: ion channel [Segetibacter sp.]
MAKTKINTRAASTIESGFGTNSSYSAGRFYNKDGSPNLSVKGINFLQRFSIYNSLLNFSTARFLCIILCFYLAVNLLFAFIYLIAGIEHLGGIEQETEIGKFWESFFFSAQTLSTVGYGHVYPKSLLANAIAATESVLGLLTFAIITGVIYARFAKPRAYIQYSKNALFAPFKTGTAIMFRLAPYKHNHLMDAEVKVSLVMRIEEHGITTNRFFTLPLEYSKINSLTLSWTVVHPLTEESPFYNLNKQDLIVAQAELLVFVKAFDESFSTTVISRTSYTADEFVEGGKFIHMYNPNEERNKTLLHIDKLDLYEQVALPELTRPVTSKNFV